MKTLLLASVLALVSLNSFAQVTGGSGPGNSSLSNACPDVNGIFACTGLDKDDEGSIVKVETRLTDKGLSQVLLNNQIYMTEGKKGVFCNNNTIQDSGRAVTHLDIDSFEKTFTWEVVGQQRTVSSTCVRLK